MSKSLKRDHSNRKATEQNFTKVFILSCIMLCWHVDEILKRDCSEQNFSILRARFSCIEFCGFILN